MKSELISSDMGLGEYGVEWRLRLYAVDVVHMEKEQKEMIEDGLWLIQQGLAKNIHSPLSTPLLGLPVRLAEQEET